MVKIFRKDAIHKFDRFFRFFLFFSMTSMISENPECLTETENAAKFYQRENILY
ncbi:hypothetical protein LEP1GSC193_3178 [Leptospira alstonii serovar Pingchang str. 80-412]|uniref:Uncharacterized protein n=2 Tax=Leptospira alstonii TaxID=28452 RepID=M6DGF4_9LEPT|nr:hypothetical protein LEP1GSC194_2957 [Leptospira alstonii serovar Sichuan str. 79601]EQA79354.1 hypothetical protein LEP1GSC193_3178 [Leptospira alstonii serovar Pingchang str. 80-412]